MYPVETAVVALEQEAQQVAAAPEMQMRLEVVAGEGRKQEALAKPLHVIVAQRVALVVVAVAVVEVMQGGRAVVAVQAGIPRP